MSVVSSIVFTQSKVTSEELSSVTAIKLYTCGSALFYLIAL